MDVSSFAILFADQGSVLWGYQGISGFVLQGFRFKGFRVLGSNGFGFKSLRV